MAVDRLKQVVSHIIGAGTPNLPHPFDPLSESEIERAVSIVRERYANLFYNAVTLWEPRKAEMMIWLANPASAARPHRVVDIVAIGRGSKVYDGLVDLNQGTIIQWELTDDVQPLVRS